MPTHDNKHDHISEKQYSMKVLNLAVCQTPVIGSPSGDLTMSGNSPLHTGVKVG